MMRTWLPARLTIHRSSRVALVLSLLVWSTGARAADKYIGVPSGWKWKYPPVVDGTFALSAIALQASGGQQDGVAVIENGVATVVPMPGAVLSIEIAADDAHLLVRHEAAPGTEATSLVSRVDLHSYQLSWTKPGERIYSFSTTGEAIQSIEDTTDQGVAETTIRVHDFDGTSDRRLVVTAALVDAVTVATGDEIVLGYSGTIRHTRNAPSIGSDWTLNVGRHEPALAALPKLLDGTVSMKLLGSRWHVITDDRERRFSHGRGSFEVSFPGLDWFAYVDHQPHALADGSGLLLHADGDPKGLRYEYATGSMTSVSIDLQIPSGLQSSGSSGSGGPLTTAELVPGLHGCNLFFLSSSALAIRGVQ